MPSFDATCSMVSTVINSQSRKSNSVGALQKKTIKVNVPGIGTAMQMPSGDIRVDYKDGSILTVTPQKYGGGILYESSNGSILRLNQSHPNEMPSIVAEKLCHLPHIVKLLVQLPPKSIR